MGTKVYVAATSTRMVEDLPDTNTNSMVKAVLTGSSFQDEMMEANLGGLYTKSRGFLKYAEETYTFGLPQGTVHNRFEEEADDITKATIEGIEGAPITLMYTELSIADATYWVHPYLQDTRGWVLGTDDVVTIPHTTPPVTAGPVTFDSAGFTSTPNTIEITYKYTDGDEDFFPTEIISTYPITQSDTYYHVAYFVIDGTGKAVSPVKYWFYAPSTKVYPQFVDLPKIFTNPYYPIVPIRRNKVDLATEYLRETEQFITTEKLLGKMDIDFIDLAEGINENPGIADIDHAYLYFGVDLHSDTPTAPLYLWEYFNYLNPLVPLNKSNNAEGRRKNRVDVEDAGLRLSIFFDFIEKTTVEGVIGLTGAATRESFPDEAPTLHYTTVTSTGDSGDTTYEVLDHTQDNKHVIFKKQISPTHYEQIKVTGLVHHNYVYGSHNVSTNIKASSDPDDSNFIIPLNRYVVELLPYNDKSNLMYESLVLLFNSYQIVKTKWYQSSVFKALIVILAIVIIVLSWGSASGPVYAGVTAIFGTGVAGFVAFVIVSVAIGQLVSYAFSFLVKELGITNSFILAAVLVITAGIQLASGGGFTGLPDASTLLMVSAAIQGGIGVTVAEEMKDLMSQYQDFSVSSALLTEDLERAESLLDNSFTLDPMDLFGRIEARFAYEAPTDFYNRTIHAGNIGVLTLKMVDSYVDTALMLPKDVRSTLV